MTEIANHQPLIDSFLKMMPPKAAPVDKVVSTETAPADLVQKLVEKAQGELLWDGNWDYGSKMFGTPYPSQSEADYALLGAIVRHATSLGIEKSMVGDATIRVFEQSGLYRPEKRVTKLSQDIPKLIASQFSGATARALNGPRLKDGRINFTDALPPPRDYVLEDIILANKPCVLAGLGGVSKTMLLMMLSVHVALGRNFLSKATKTGCVLLVLGEEDHEEINRRFNAISKHLNLSDADIKLVGERVRAYPLFGEDARFSKAVGTAVEGTDFPDEIVDATNQLETETGLPVALIGLDHAGLIHGGDFNAREAVVQTMTQVGKIVKGTGAATMVLAHSPKASVGKDEADQNDVTGSAAWVDLSRGAYILKAMSLAEAKDLDVNPDIRNIYVSLTAVKANYGPTGLKIWMMRNTVPNYGVSVLDHVTLVKQQTVSNRSSLKARVKDFIRQRPGEFTITSLRETEGGKDGRFKKGKNLVASVAKDLIDIGELELIEPTEDQRNKHNLRDPKIRVLAVADDCKVQPSPLTPPAAGGLIASGRAADYGF